MLSKLFPYCETRPVTTYWPTSWHDHKDKMLLLVSAPGSTREIHSREALWFNDKFTEQCRREALPCSNPGRGHTSEPHCLIKDPAVATSPSLRAGRGILNAMSHIVQFSSVPQLCLTLCDPKDCSSPGSSVHHQLPEFAQTHVHQISDAIQPSYPLSSHSPPAFNLSQQQGIFQ